MGFWDNLKHKAMMKSFEKQIKHLPSNVKDTYLNAMKNEPEFFKEMFNEIQKKMKAGKSEAVASAEVGRLYQGKLTKILMGKK